MDGHRAVKRNEANWPVRKSIRVRKEAVAPSVRDEMYEADYDAERPSDRELSDTAPPMDGYPFCTACWKYHHATFTRCLSK